MRLIPILFIGSVVSAYWEYLDYLLWTVLLFICLKIAIGCFEFYRSFVRNDDMKDIDKMAGIDFEYYIAELLGRNGYTNISLTEQYDYGVDVIAERDGIRWGVQVKRYSGLVKAEAVRQVVTGLKLYGCDRAMVITNSVYSNVAQRLAEANDCILVDRDELYRMTH